MLSTFFVTLHEGHLKRLIGTYHTVLEYEIANSNLILPYRIIPEKE